MKKDGIGKNMTDFLTDAKTIHSLSKEEIVALLSEDTRHDALLKAADDVRRRYVGDEIHLRGLIEFSNRCRRNCMYCGLRRDNLRAERYRLPPERILDLVGKARACGYRTIVLQSGEDPYYTVERMTEIIRGIKAMDLALTLSIGEKTFEEYKAFRDAGADRYLLRIETTDRDLYHRLDPGMSWENRVRCLDDLRTLGYEVGTGSLVGLPGQSLESIADDILFFKDIKADMVGIGPFIPHPDTPLGAEAGGTLKLSLRVMAVLRLLLPDINIPATTAMEALHPEGRLMALQGGANVIMPNVTEAEYRKLYILYPGKPGTDSEPAVYRSDIAMKIRSIGRSVSEGYGFHGDYLKGRTPAPPQ
mgnify:CR=1 FL=1|jgi:biotin synthase